MSGRITVCVKDYTLQYLRNQHIFLTNFLSGHIMGLINNGKDRTLAKAQEEAKADNLEKIEKRIDSLDSRLDNIDSIVSAVAERVMQQPITLNVTCSHCGHKIEIAIIGTEKPTAK
jgi:dihydroorotate dehydrogenase